MTAILGTFVSMKTMADNTPRITIDLSCSLSEFAALNVIRGAEFAIARMTEAASLNNAQQETIAKGDDQAMGSLCKWAVMRCKEPEFADFIRPIYDRIMGGDGSRWGDVTPDDFEDGKEGYIRHCMLVICKVDSRKDLDRPNVAIEFKSQIMHPWSVSEFNPHR